MYVKIQEAERIKIISLICALITEGQYAVFLHPDSPQSAHVRVSAVADGFVTTTSFVH